MSTDPAIFVIGVPVKISEKYRPPRKVNLPASCQHEINLNILTQEYDFAVEETTLQWLLERRNRIERDKTIRRERIAEYEKKIAELKLKEENLKKENYLKQEKEEEELKRGNEEQITFEEEKDTKKEETSEDQSQEVEKGIDGNNRDMSAIINTSQNAEVNGNETLAGNTLKHNSLEVISHETPQAISTSVIEDSSYCSSDTINTSIIICKGETNNVSNNTTPYDFMLKPTPIRSHKSVRSPSKSSTDINFADFEGEGNDPFDSAALKSINDMEELAKVLDSSHVTVRSTEGTSSVQDPTTEKQSYCNTYPNGQLTYSAFGQYPYFLSSHQQLQQSLQQQNMTQPVQGFIHYGDNSTKNPQIAKASSITSSSDLPYTKDPARNFKRYYPQPWGSGYNVNNSSKTAQFVPYDYCLQAANITTSVSNATQGVVASSNNTATLPTYTSDVCSTVLSVEKGSTISKRQDLEDFYSRYYLQNKSHVHPSQQSGIQSGESTPSHSSSSGAAGSTSGSLRSCRSVPDLTAAEDSEVTKYSSGSHTQKDIRGISHTPPPRPSSTGLTGLEDWKPLPDISELSKTSSTQLLNQTSPTQRTVISSVITTSMKSRLPDPFEELTTDAQALVQNMAEMGFPRSRVARAVQKLGTDHKKLIEVLLVLQSLQGNGEDGYKAERAFYHYMGDVQKTKDHLVTAKQLLDLGFEEEQVVDALLKHDNDRDKALEELIA